MGLLGFFKKNTSSDVAKERLLMVLSYERRGLPTNFAEVLQTDLKAVFSKYPQFDYQNLVVEIKSENNREELYVGIPFSEKRGSKQKD